MFFQLFIIFSKTNIFSHSAFFIQLFSHSVTLVMFLHVLNFWENLRLQKKCTSKAYFPPFKQRCGNPWCSIYSCQIFHFGCSLRIHDFIIQKPVPTSTCSATMHTFSFLRENFSSLEKNSLLIPVSYDFLKVAIFFDKKE